MERGDMEARVEWSCEVGHRRARKLGHYDGPVDQSTRATLVPEILLPVFSSGHPGHPDNRKAE
jgi:hypothetical protein